MRQLSPGNKAGEPALAKWKHIPMLKIYRQIEKFYSFLLFVLSHAKEALARGVHFF
jgi:hypothetical protein